MSSSEAIGSNLFLPSAPRLGRRGPPTGVFRRFEALVEATEEVAAKRNSPPPPAPRATMTTLPWGSQDDDGIEEISCVEAPPSSR